MHGNDRLYSRRVAFSEFGCLALTALISPCELIAHSASFIASSVSVLDGDTIEVQHNGRAKHIRLNGVNSSEKSQVYGKRAKQSASRLVFGKEVILQTYGKDKYVEFIRIVTGNALIALVA